MRFLESWEGYIWNFYKVSARDLYDLLSSQGGLTGTERFSKWFERYIKYGFKENIDFSTPYKKVRVQIEGKREVSREIEDYDLVLQCKDLITTTVIAKDYGMSASGFNKMLKDLGIQYKQGDIWVLYSKYQGCGYLQTKTHNYVDADGVQHAKQHSYWTQKGRLFLYEKLKNRNVVPLIEREVVD